MCETPEEISIKITPEDMRSFTVTTPETKRVNCRVRLHWRIILGLALLRLAYRVSGMNVETEKAV